jgi:WD40 repeat protein
MLESKSGFAIVTQLGHIVCDLYPSLSLLIPEHFFVVREPSVICAGEDGKILVWDCSNWSIQTDLVGHNGPVHSLSIHPSGKLAVSVGRDKKLMTWNLIKGRTLYVTNLKTVANVVRYSSDGRYYAVGLMEPNARVDVYSTETAGMRINFSFLFFKFISSSNEFVFFFPSWVKFYNLECSETEEIGVRLFPRWRREMSRRK